MKKYISLLALSFACAGIGPESDQQIGQTEQEMTAFGFYGVRNDGANKQRLCAGAPTTSQQCLLPALSKRVRVRLNTSGMTSGDATLAQQWVTAIINNTFNISGGNYEPTGWTWQETIHQPHVTIVKGIVDNSLGADNTDVRRYLRLSCNDIRGALTENPSKNGTYQVCASWTATLDTDKMRALNSAKMSQMIHQCVSLAMLAPAGIGVGTITPGVVTQQTIANAGHLATAVSARDLCALTVFDPADTGSVNLLSECQL